MTIENLHYHFNIRHLTAFAFGFMLKVELCSKYILLSILPMQ